MKKLLYSARDADGKPCQAYVDAASNEEARRKLAALGLREVVLHDDAFIAGQRDELAALAPDELAKLAAFELGVRKHGSDTAGFLKQVLRRNRTALWIGLALTVWGLERGDFFLTAGGLLTLGTGPVISLWNYRQVGRYNRLLRQLAWGEWAAARASVAELKPHMSAPNHAFDLAIKEACIIARTRSLSEARAFIAPWAAKMQAPGYFEARTAVIHLLSGDSAGFLAGMKAAHVLAWDSPTTRIDYALAEARFGDPAIAAELIASLSPEALPPMALPFLAWIRGLIAYRRKAPDAVEKLAEAVDAMAAGGDNPAFWITQALCVGAYAAALLAVGREAAARQAVEKVWPVLRQHGDAALLADLAVLHSD